MNVAPLQPTVKLSPDEAAPYLAQVAELVTVARPGALFPPPKPMQELLAFLGRPRPRAGPPVVEVHRASGLPVARMLSRLLAHQVAVREFLASHRAKATRASVSYHVALAATALPPVSHTTARLMGREGRRTRLQVVHDAVLPDGTPRRLTVQLTQAQGRPFPVDRRDQAEVPESIARALADVAANAELGEVWPALEHSDGVVVHEVERGQLGPLVSSHVAGPEAPGAFAEALGALVRAAGGAVLSLVLERAGESVRAASCVDPWGRLPALSEALAARRVIAFRERRLLCTPGLEDAVKALAKGCIVRAR
ncbi:MAG: hypothetical protein AB1938_01270 [Myxococcota bacterium]